MKNTKLFLSLAVAGIYAACGACEDANFYRDTQNAVAVIPAVEVVVFEEKSENDSYDGLLADLFPECYKNHNAQACQKIMDFMEQKALVDKLILLNLLNEKQHTIDTHEETIANFNQLNRRRNERINKRKDAR